MKREKRKVRIGDARRIADEVGADAVIVIAFGVGRMAGASYGQTRNICGAAGKVLDRIIDGLVGGRIRADELADALDRSTFARDVTAHKCGADEAQEAKR